MTRRGATTFCFFLWICSVSFCQELSIKQEDFHFEKLSGEPQLERGTVLEILEDHQGFIWLGTDKGLSRFDGYTYKWFANYPPDSNSLQNNWVKAMILDRTEDVLWLGTDIGFSRFDIRKEKFDNYSNLVDSGKLTSPPAILQLSQDQEGKIWLGTIANGLLCYNPKNRSLTQYTSESELPISSDFVTHTFHSKRGEVLINTNNGIDLLDPENKEIDHLDARKALIDKNGKIWTFSHNKLQAYDPIQKKWVISPDSEHLVPYIAPLQASFVDDRPRIWIDSMNNLWAAEERSLIRYQLDHRQLSIFEHEDELFNFSVWSFFPDSRQSTWIGTMSGGYYRLDGHRKKFHFFPVPEDSQEVPGAIFRAGDDRFWITLDKIHLFDIENQLLTPFPLEQSKFREISEYIINCLHTDRNDNLWIGTLFGGLFRYDVEGRKLLRFNELGDNPINRLDHAWIRTLLEDHRGQIWIADNDQIHIYQPLTNQFRSLPYSVKCLWEDQEGVIWAGSYGSKLFRIDPSNLDIKVYQLDDRQLLAFKAVISDSKGRIWLIAESEGLILFDPQKGNKLSRQWRKYNSNLPSDDLKTLIFDDNGDLWIGADLGLIKFDTEQYKVSGFYTEKDTNVQGTYFNSWKNQEGHLTFSTSSGLLYFHPDDIKANPVPPEVRIIDFSINNQSIPIRGTFQDTLGYPSPLLEAVAYVDQLKLEYWQNDLAFEFTTLNYSNPEQNQYAYQLEGYNNNWVYTNSKNRKAFYTNLRPGSYIFRVKASNNDGIWNEEGTSLSIFIARPWWKTGWAYFSYAVLFLCAITGIYRYQLSRQLAITESKRLRELDAVKSQLYTNISHEFRTPITLILGITDLIANQVSEQLKENLKIVSRNGQGLLKLVNQMLDLSKIESKAFRLNLIQGDIISYLKSIFSAFHTYAESRDIELLFHSNVSSLHMDYDPDRFMQVISNLVSNAIKFTPSAGKVKLLVAYLNESAKEPVLEIIIHDNGVGIPQKDLSRIFDRFYQADHYEAQRTTGSGIGLTLTKELVELMGGTIKADSTYGRGSRFTVILPVRKTAKLKNMEAMEASAIPYLPSLIKKSAPLPNLQSGQKSFGKELPELLLIEDHPDLVRYIESCLSSNYQIAIAENGQEGIDMAIAQVPDLIITDVMMPLKDGYQVCENLKKHELTSHIPIIILTAKVDLASRLHGFRRGADAYLAKPFYQKELEVRIDALLKQRRNLQAYYRKTAGLSELNTEAIPPNTEAAIENSFLQKVNRVIEQNLQNEDFNVEQMSQSLLLSSSGLYRKITALTGTNPSKYIRSLRIKRAQQLLKSTDKTIATIAFETGFKDPDHFSRVFKKEVGKTPSLFRQAPKN